MYDSEFNPVIGIDLGTTYTSIARWSGNSAQVYSPKGERSIPSSVFYDDKSKKFLFGKIALMNGILKPHNLCVGVKRLMDKKDYKITLGENEYSPIDISAMILKNIYGNVSTMFPENMYSPLGAVVTVPYYFKSHQCENTKLAIKKAGIKLLGIIQEPIAAAFSYGLKYCFEKTNRDENILVFDLGGGTFDITIFNVKENQTKILFQVLSIGGNDKIGGLDFDKSFLDYIIEKEGIDFNSCDDKKLKNIGKQKLMDSVIKAKESLSCIETCYLGVPDVIPGVHIDSDYTREDFEESISVYLEQIKIILKDTIIASGISIDSINKVIKVGGSSKIPAMNKIIEEVVGPKKVYSDIDPSLCVAQGAAIYAAYLSNNVNLNKRIQIQTATAHSLGVEDANGNMVVLIHANQKTPAKKTMMFTTDEDNCTSLDVKVFQGPSRKTKNNCHVGTVKIKGIKAMKKFMPKIKITFEVGKDQTVSVTVCEIQSNFTTTQILKLA